MVFIKPNKSNKILSHFQYNFEKLTTRIELRSQKLHKEKNKGNVMTGSYTKSIQVGYPVPFQLLAQVIFKMYYLRDDPALLYKYCVT